MKGYVGSIQAARQDQTFVGSEWNACMIYLGEESHSCVSRYQFIGNFLIGGQLVLQPRSYVGGSLYVHSTSQFHQLEVAIRIFISLRMR